MRPESGGDLVLERVFRPGPRKNYRTGGKKECVPGLPVEGTLRGKGTTLTFPDGFYIIGNNYEGNGYGEKGDIQWGIRQDWKIIT